MIEIKEVENESIAAGLGLLPGDNLVSINGFGVSDLIDYRFLAADDNIDISMKRDGEEMIFSVEKEPDTELGLTFVPMRFKSCCNKCVFCYVDQLPAGMRLSLYFKDGDYRLSFLHGNFVTLSNTSWKELRRIVDQRLSPIYLSVHSTDPKVRKRLLGMNSDDDILGKIRFLDENNVEMHTQVVLCPGLNDGDSLERSISDLWEFRGTIRSLAVVPVGLTKHREALTQIDPVTSEYAERVIAKEPAWCNKYTREDGKRFIYLADEWFVIAGLDVPPTEYYDEFPQLDNGVGLVRDFLNDLDEAATRFPESVDRPVRITLVTGKAAATILIDNLIPYLNRVENLEAELLEVENDFLGPTVTVAGLLTGSDILRSLEESPGTGSIFLPPRCVNADGLLLDNMHVKDLSSLLNRHVQVFNGNFLSLIG